MEQRPGDRSVPWAEAAGLAVILVIGLVAYLVSRPPEPAPEATTAIGATDPGFREQGVVGGGDPLEAEPQEKAGRKDRGASGKKKGAAATGGLEKPRRIADLATLAEANACVQPEDARLRVASFNVHSGWNRGRTRLMLPQLAAEMRRLEADVLLLQEVDQNRPASRRVNQPAYYAGQLGMGYVFATNVLRPGNSRYGTAVLSSLPVTEHANTRLPRPSGTQQRGLLRTVVEVFPGVEVSLYNTHLEHTSEATRITQARAIAAVLAQDPHPAVLGGDLNSRPASTAVTTLRSQVADTWPLVGQGAGLTHPQVSPRSRIDYVMADPALPALASYVVPSAVSDHRAVVVDLDLSGVLAGTVPVCP